MTAVVHRRLADAQAARCADGARDRARGGDDQRHVRADGHHHCTPSTACSRPRTRRPTPWSWARARSPAASASAPPVPATVVSRIRALPQVRDVQGFVQDTGRSSETRTAAAISPGTTAGVRRPGQGIARSTRPQVVAGQRPTGPGEIVVDEQTASEQPPCGRLDRRPGVAVIRLSCSMWSGWCATAVSARRADPAGGV